MLLVIRHGYLVHLTRTVLVVSLRHTRKNVSTKVHLLVKTLCLTGGLGLQPLGITVRVSVTTMLMHLTNTDSMNLTTWMYGQLVN